MRQVRLGSEKPYALIYKKQKEYCLFVGMLCFVKKWFSDNVLLCFYFNSFINQQFLDFYPDKILIRVF